MADKIIKDNIAKVDAIVSLAAPRTFANTILAYAKFEQEYSTAAVHILFLKNVSPDPEVRAAISKVSKAFSDADLALENRKDLYNAFVEYRDKNQGEVQKMTAEDQRYLQKII